MSLGMTNDLIVFKATNCSCLEAMVVLDLFASKSSISVTQIFFDRSIAELNPTCDPLPVSVFLDPVDDTPSVDVFSAPVLSDP